MAEQFKRSIAHHQWPVKLTPVQPHVPALPLVQWGDERRYYAMRQSATLLSSLPFLPLLQQLPYALDPNRVADTLLMEQAHPVLLLQELPLAVSIKES